jgi:hypothetical protein
MAYPGRFSFCHQRGLQPVQYKAAGFPHRGHRPLTDTHHQGSRARHYLRRGPAHAHQFHEGHQIGGGFTGCATRQRARPAKAFGFAVLVRDMHSLSRMPEPPSTPWTGQHHAAIIIILDETEKIFEW